MIYDEDCLKISIWDLKQLNLLVQGKEIKINLLPRPPRFRIYSLFREEVSLYVDLVHEKIIVGYEFMTYSDSLRTGEKIFLNKTRCKYGGTRWWLICPVRSCWRQVGVLYLAPRVPKGATLACRKCLKIRYESQKARRRFYWRKPEWIRTRLLKQIDKLSKRMKRKNYGGKVTKKWMKLEKIKQKLNRI